MRQKMNNSLKRLAKEARERLKTAGEYANNTKSVYLTNSNSYVVVANIRRIEDDPIFPKVKKILEREKEEIIVNPISLVIDKKEFLALDQFQKERYMLKLSKRFNAIKEYILSGDMLEKKELLNSD